MGGAVSSGRDNNELIDNLMSGNYIRTKQIEMVFRALDRADYMTPEARDQAYKDLAWRNGPLHLSSPCIYSEVMEGLELKPGLSFLNIGSGTGYLSSLVGLILGTSGISHGVEVHPAVVEYATKKIGQFIENSPTLDEFDFCKPKYYHGNGLCLSPPDAGYDRVYCGAACPTECEMYFKQLIKVGGVLVMPLNDTLLQVRRVTPDKWVSRCLLNVTFSPLRIPGADEATELVRLDTLRPVGLQLLSRAVVRTAMRGGVLRRHPELRLAPRPPPAACPRRICIPIEPGGSVDGLNVLHDLDNESGANEMNALLSLVISMGQNRVAGTLRYDRYEYASDDENEDDGDENEVDGDEDEDDGDEDDGDDDEDDGDDDEDDDDDDDEDDSDENEDERDENEDSRERGGEQAVGRVGAVKSTPRDDRLPASDADDAPSRTRGTSGGPAEEERRHGARRRPRKAGYTPGGACPPEDAARKRRDPKPSTSHGPGSVGDVLRSTEERSKKETAIDDDRKTDKVTGPIRELPGVPSVVEIELGETSDMEWDGSAERLDHSDDDAAKIKPKRQKLDSGIGESPPGASSPDGSKADDPGAGDPAAADGAPVTNRSCSPGPEERAHTERRRRREARGGDARRVRLSLLMKQAVRELPLPHALKKFVNLGRCFEF